MNEKPETIDAYLALLDESQRNALQALRETIRAAAPDAEECISYQQPAFRLGRMLVGFGAAKKHCALYLMSNSTLTAFADELEGWDTSKGTVRFSPDKPLPADLVKRLVAARRLEIDAQGEKKRQHDAAAESAYRDHQGAE